ncbi:efflux RND transporter periplasmic adaptor subunit [Aminobacterium mobile]|uniref:efflux RND transporter periplasmic adaptor subunit n=1 Tax=Aminobacterium mobile TaxID=81467 RepID=UPI0033163EB4
MKKSLMLFSVVVIFIALIGFRAFQQHQIESAVGEIERVKVEVVSPKQGTFVDIVRFVATLEPEEEAAVISKVPGKTVLQVLVHEGDKVQEGDILAILDASLIEQQVSQAQASLAKAEIYKQTAENDYRRFSQLYKEEVISRQQYDHVEGEYKTSVRQVAETKAVLEQLKITKGYHRIEAPISGIITARNVDAGDTTSSYPVFVIAKQEQVKAVGVVPEKLYSKVRAGQETHISLDAFPGRSFKAKVARVSPILDPATRTGKVEVAVDALSLMKPGMYARVEIQAGTHEGLGIPLDAVMKMAGTGLPICYVATEDGTAKTKQITLGEEGPDAIEVIEGISLSDKVIITRSEKLSEGTPIEVVQR